MNAPPPSPYVSITYRMTKKINIVYLWLFYYRKHPQSMEVIYFDSKSGILIKSYQVHRELYVFRQSGHLFLKVRKQFVNYYNNQRYHESLNNITPADMYNGKDKQIQLKRNRIKRETMKLRKYHNLMKYQVV